jgi:hypothetical protein
MKDEWHYSTQEDRAVFISNDGGGRLREYDFKKHPLSSL